MFSALLDSEPTLVQSLTTNIAPDDAPTLSKPVDRVTSARRERKLAFALRRFDRAHERDNIDDALIDLWIAIEAILVPESHNIKLLASHRIAQLSGPSAEDRQHACNLLARESYRARSIVVQARGHRGRWTGSSRTLVSSLGSCS